MTEPLSPIPIDDDRMRVGQPVIVDGLHFVVTKFSVNETCFLTETGAVLNGPATIDLTLEPATWVDPGVVESGWKLSAADLTASRLLELDGRSYLLALGNTERRYPGGKPVRIGLQLWRQPWMDKPRDTTPSGDHREQST